MKRQWNLWLAALIGLSALGGGCECAEAPASSSSDGKPLVVATIGMIGDVASRIAGEHATVATLMGSGTDPHLYKPTPSDLDRLGNAALILYNGLHLEGKMTDVLVQLARERPVVAVADAVPEAERREPPEFAGMYDPHVWFDVRLWMHTLDPIAEALGGIDPAHADVYRANAEVYRAEFERLDAWIEEQIASLPEARRVMVTAHDAFGYFGARYGVEVIALQGISTASEASLRDREALVETIVSRRIPAIFVESSIPRRTIEAVQERCRERGHEVVIGGELFSDAMGAAGTDEGTYLGMIRHNVDTFVRAME